MTTSPAAFRDPDRLKGRVAIVTGAAKGLGGAISESLWRQGASLVLCGRDYEALTAHAKSLGDPVHPSGQGLLAVSCNVLDEPAVVQMVSDAMAKFGRVDILVNTAGGIGPIETPVQEYPLEGFQSVLNLNVLGTFIPCKAVVPSLIAAGGGRIVNIAGTSGLHGYANRVGYSSSKWAVRGMTRTLALELGKYGITVNTVCPNVTHGDRMDKIIQGKSDRLGKTTDEVYADFVAETSLGRFIDDIDIAEAVSFLVGDSARNITGQDLVVDAGFRI
jgi:NAD(P)-dependent dehydrogenase (short-subunit alcohol dehydrogenase family)